VTRSFTFYQKKNTISGTGTFQGHVPKKPYKSDCITRVVVPLDPLSPQPSTSSVMQTQEITHEDPDTPKPANDGDIQMEYSILVVQPEYRKSN
jgi:hypothetical protein